MPDDHDMAEMFARMARELESATDPSDTRDVITRSAVETVPGCDHAGISLIQRNGRVVTAAATDPVVTRIDAIQYELQEGPGLGAIADHAVYTIDDVAEVSTKWPEFTRRAAQEFGVASMLSFRLFSSGQTVGALNLYGRHPHAFTDGSRAMGAILAAHAALSMVAANEHDEAVNLGKSLVSSRQIGTAIGIVMVRQGLDQETAFAFLVDASQRANKKLRELADVIVEAGDIPGRRP
ncbi:GAF domain-containing protein [Pseudonocardia ammonioxydans]|uniref:GAF domain-containing protein n=1 Tax=Pseudonocardia ammonioxydans TaxID=260086 RepID=A0A1I4WMS8_PSUAM|nr:GAF and ANTAR domain-containing protein [Pseudonocardia ammonioxydans]SFN15184.1 GAF domain-containing protein [Pseudonocardia ammonioxydans]